MCIHYMHAVYSSVRICRWEPTLTRSPTAASRKLARRLMPISPMPLPQGIAGPFLSPGPTFEAGRGGHPPGDTPNQVVEDHDLVLKPSGLVFWSSILGNPQMGIWAVTTCMQRLCMWKMVLTSWDLRDANFSVRSFPLLSRHARRGFSKLGLFPPGSWGGFPWLGGQANCPVRPAAGALHRAGGWERCAPPSPARSFNDADRAGGFRGSDTRADEGIGDLQQVGGGRWYKIARRWFHTQFGPNIWMIDYKRVCWILD